MCENAGATKRGGSERIDCGGRIPMLRGKKVVLGVTGGIAAYKAVELLRELVKREANVQVVMTKHAKEFVAPLTFQSLSGNRVVHDLFEFEWSNEIGHIALADAANITVIAPATANMIGKIAHGVADDFLSTLVMALTCPLVLAPAMNTKMWHNSIVQQNLATLKRHGYTWVEPGTGDLACGAHGQGRMAEVFDIVEQMQDLLCVKDFTGCRMLITAGPTVEGVDPVRYITNRSSGKMGYAIARMARRRGAEVVLISGPSLLPPPRKDILFVPVRSATDMRTAVFDHYRDCGVIIMAAAVADFRPKNVFVQKVKKGKDDTYLMELEKTPDILEELGSVKGNRILVGFAAETQNLIENAEKKLRSKKADLFVANDVSQPGAGFEVDTNIVTILSRRGKRKDLPLMAKDEVADIILNQIAKMMRRKNKPS
jgi:phosphopantothenoylcysteine decarboxylase/phosphopantothenate--cysteine ligase